MVKKASPFAHVSKIYERNSTYEDDGAYVQYIINKELSKNGIVAGFINHVQQYQLPNHIHFKLMNYMMGGVPRPGFKEFPWIWKKKEEHSDEIEVIAKYYEESISNAKDYYEILIVSKEGKEHIKWLMDVYGKNN